MPRTGKREAIMQAAEKLFTSRRFHEITLDDIVREARIGKGTIYTYFKDKDDLFLQVGMSGFDELCDLLQHRIAGDAPCRAQLLQASAAIGAFFRRRKQLFRMFQSEDARMSLCRGNVRAQWQQRRRHLVTIVGRIISKGQSEGALREDAHPELLAGFLLGLLRARVRDIGSETENVTDEFLVDFFMFGAGRHEPSVRQAETTSFAESEA